MKLTKKVEAYVNQAYRGQPQFHGLISALKLFTLLFLGSRVRNDNRRLTDLTETTVKALISVSPRVL